MEIINTVVLALSGLLFIYAGTMRLIKPLGSFCLQTYLENPNIKLEAKVDIFNEMRSAGASIALGGVIMLLGIFIKELMMASFIVAIVIFLGYAFGRLVSLKADGKPNKQIIQGLISEVVLGTANALCLINILM
jgi:hypothetical protein